MIVSQYFGHPRLKRNIGNQLFELASLVGLSKRYNTTLHLPDTWQNMSFFKHISDLNFKTIESFVTIEEPGFHCCLDYFDRFEAIIKNECVNIEGFLQSERYWKPYESDIRRLFMFNDKIFQDSQSFLVENKIKVDQFVAISVRRGDFATDPYHYLLPIDYYLGAYSKYFEDKKIIIFSDDITWCKKSFPVHKQEIIFPEQKKPIEQLSLMSCFDNFIIANSTFSWWGAYLSTNQNKLVVRPHHHFDGELKNLADIADHYPVKWIEYNYENDKLKHSKQTNTE